MIKVMSFNIRYATAVDGINNWENRRRLVIERIQVFEPDVLGVQECQEGEQAAFLRENLPGYRFFGVPRGVGGHLVEKFISHVDLEMTAVIFREATFDLIEQGVFWLSRTPEVAGSKSWGSMFPRTATWVHLREKRPPFAEFCYCNAHLDHFSRRARLEAAKLIRARMADKGNIPVILSGDFNTRKNYTVYQTFAGAGLRDAYRLLHPPGQTPEGTFHDFGRIPPVSFDWIFVSPHFGVQDAVIDRAHAGRLYPSDHYPVTATLAWG
jgi:endonuclease/exonuclease/phosphatase family metal-dependent hydrolase